MKKLLSTAIASAALVASAGSLAANDGSLGTTSTGDLDISLTISDVVQISKMTDITLAQNASGGADGSDTVCVYANGDGNYNLLMAGSGDANGDALELDGAATSVAYSVEFTDGTASTTQTSALVGAANAVSGFNGNATAADCGGAAATNATITVSVSPADYQAAAVDTYTDTLVLTVAPE